MCVCGKPSLAGSARRRALRVARICKILFCIFGCLFIDRFSGCLRPPALPPAPFSQRGVRTGRNCVRGCGAACAHLESPARGTWAPFESASFPLAKRFSSRRVWQVPGWDLLPITTTWLCFFGAGSATGALGAWLVWGLSALNPQSQGFALCLQNITQDK